VSNTGVAGLRFERLLEGLPRRGVMPKLAEREPTERHQQRRWVVSVLDAVGEAYDVVAGLPRRCAALHPAAARATIVPCLKLPSDEGRGDFVRFSTDC